MKKQALVGLASKVNYPVTVKFKSNNNQFILSHKRKTKKEFIESDLIIDLKEVQIIR